jgi:translation elongation factor EF-1beta
VAKYTEAKEAKKAEKLAAGKTLEVAKSVVTLQVKPWDDETDLVEMEKEVRAIEKDGLLWGASKLVPVGYGIRMLQINLVIEDAKISLDELQEEIAEIEDYVQSSDVAGEFDSHAYSSKSRAIADSPQPCRSCNRVETYSACGVIRISVVCSNGS